MKTLKILRIVLFIGQIMCYTIITKEQNRYNGALPIERGCFCNKPLAEYLYISKFDPRFRTLHFGICKSEANFPPWLALSCSDVHAKG